ncbi:MAG: ABC transporter ATP-binding protein [Acidimicrobiales bacterium]|nr:ABC transporter ATP-binding protein [Acidimicrobiales bacterium]
MVDRGALVRASGLRKSFGDFVAVDGIDFEVRPGEVFGFLGPNGAGKTSTMRMIGCVSPFTGGELEVLGMDPATDGPEIRSRIGVVPQEDNLDIELSVWDNFILYGRYFGLPRSVLKERAQELLEFARLTDRKHDRVDPLSGGMKRRLTIARALINDPDLVILDEPTTGLDPQARHLLWERLYGLKRRGVTLIITTHYMDEAEQLCDRLVIMDEGRIVDEGAPSALIDRHVTAEVLELRFETPELQAKAVPIAADVAPQYEELADRLLLYTDDGDATRTAVHDRGVDSLTALTRRSSLEDVFLALTGRVLDE